MQRQLAQLICPVLPPIVAQRVRSWIYPYAQASREDLVVRRRAVTGSLFEGTTSDFHAYPMLVHGYFERRNVAICRAVCGPGDMVIEVGANIGTETVCFADIVGREGRVIAIEPDAENFRQLERMVELNGFRHVDLYRCAAGAEDGVVVFEPPRDRNMSGMGYVRPGGAGSGLEVEARRLDWWLEQGLTRAKAVFIDVEGFEPAVLRGAERLLQEFRPVVVLEASPKLLRRNGWSLRTLLDELARHKYRVWNIGRFGLEEAKETAAKAGNWLALPEERAAEAAVVRRMLWKCGWMPRIRGLHPLEGIREGHRVE